MRGRIILVEGEVHFLCTNKDGERVYLSYEEYEGKEPITEEQLRYMAKNHTEYDLTKLDVSQVKDMSGLFWGVQSFNQCIGKWDTGNVKDMSDMFWDAESMEEKNKPMFRE